MRDFRDSISYNHDRIDELLLVLDEINEALAGEICGFNL